MPATEQFRVIAKRYANEPASVVFRTSCPENASAFAESYFINRHCHSVTAVDSRDRLLRDRNGRDFAWQRAA